MPTLLPCPFCGSTYVEVSVPLCGPLCCYVICHNPACDADGPMAETPDEAVAAWNRRAPAAFAEAPTPPDPFAALWADHSDWSQATFGTDADLGPVGPLKHLELEAREAQAEPGDASEYADCLLLVMDAARRAKLTPGRLLNAAREKLAVNKARTYPRPTTDEPSLHVKPPGPFDATDEPGDGARGYDK